VERGFHRDLIAVESVAIATLVNLATSAFVPSPIWAAGAGLLALILTAVGVRLRSRWERRQEVDLAPMPRPVKRTVPPRAATFQRRRLSDELTGSGWFVLSGAAGMGKSQLAADHAHTARRPTPS
jgi:hypothetical protein